jgi:Acetoacetate decarboxylase (ADC)
MTAGAAPRAQLVIPASGRSSLPRLPLFVEHGGEIACRHPADAIDSRLYGFVLQADRERLDAYCHRLFNAPSGSNEDWRAAGSEVLLNFVDIPTMGSTDVLDRRLGVCHEREAAIWFPVVDRKRGRFAWAVPYMFVDSALALAGGREVYGFPKQMGTLEVPVGQAAPSRLSIETVTLRTHAPDSVATNERVITVERTGDEVILGTPCADPMQALRAVIAAVDATAMPDLGARTFLDGLLGALGRRGSSLADHLPDAGPEVLFFAQLVEENIPMLLLKQFRDAHEQDAACYQAVVRVDMAVDEFRTGGLLPADFRVEIAELDAEPIGRELGVTVGVSTPRVAFWLDFDFIVRLARILWESHGERR